MSIQYYHSIACAKSERRFAHQMMRVASLAPNSEFSMSLINTRARPALREAIKLIKLAKQERLYEQRARDQRFILSIQGSD